MTVPCCRLHFLLSLFSSSPRGEERFLIAINLHFWLSFKSLSNKFGLSLPVYVSNPAHHIQKEPLLSKSPLFVCVR